MGSKIRLLLGIAVSALLLWVVFRGTDWATIATAISQANYMLLAAACGVTMLGVVLRVFRWRALFWPNNRSLSTNALFDALNLGYLANNILPARAGDVLRAYFIGEWDRVTVAQALATTAVERVLDLLIVVVMLFALLPFLPLSPELRQAGALFGSAAILAAVAMIVLSFQRALSHRLLRAVLSRVPRLDGALWADRIIEILDGFAILRAPGPFLRVLGWSAVVWIEAILVYILTFRAFGLNTLGPVEATLTIVGAAFGMALPSAPSAVGTFHAGATAALLAVGVAPPMAKTLAVTLHAINFVPLTILGFWSLARRGLRYTDLTHRSAAVAQKQATP